MGDTGENVLFGYTHVNGVPPCPCRDPGDYMMCVQGPGPLDFTLRCWCGSTMGGQWDDEAERKAFLATHSGRDVTGSPDGLRAEG